jgi:hypothetical protein
MMGQNTLFVNNIQTLLAYSSDIQNEIELSAEPHSGSYQFYMEEKVQLEEWMIEQNGWTKETTLAPAAVLRVEPESGIPTESWMIRPFRAGSQETWDFLLEVAEEPIEVRKWMICCTDWNLKTRPASGLSSPVITLD